MLLSVNLQRSWCKHRDVWPRFFNAALNVWNAIWKTIDYTSKWWPRCFEFSSELRLTKNPRGVEVWKAWFDHNSEKTKNAVVLWTVLVTSLHPNHVPKIRSKLEKLGRGSPMYVTSIVSFVIRSACTDSTMLAMSRRCTITCWTYLCTLHSPLFTAAVFTYWSVLKAERWERKHNDVIMIA